MTRRVYDIFFALTVLLMLLMAVFSFCIYSKTTVNDGFTTDFQLVFNQLNNNDVSTNTVLISRV